MATTIKQSFQKFKENLEITDRQSGIISTCRSNIVNAFADSHIILNDTSPTKVIGSYDRDTLISPLSSGDVDVMIVLHYEKNKEYYNSEGTIKILDKFRYVLDKKYPNTDKRRDRNCITLQFSEFRLDVVPAFSDKSGYYWIPDSVEKKWIDTDPISFAEKITGINKTMNGNFVPLIKMVKAWNKANGDLLNGYHLECIMEDRYGSYSTSYTYDSMLKAFFSDLPLYLAKNCLDPVRYERVDIYLDSSRQSAIKKAEQAKIISALAFEKSEKLLIKESVELWKNLLGNQFPSYG